MANELNKETLAAIVKVREAIIEHYSSWHYCEKTLKIKKLVPSDSWHETKLYFKKSGWFFDGDLIKLPASGYCVKAKFQKGYQENSPRSLQLKGEAIRYRDEVADFVRNKVVSILSTAPDLSGEGVVVSLKDLKMEHEHKTVSEQLESSQVLKSRVLEVLGDDYLFSYGIEDSKESVFIEGRNADYHNIVRKRLTLIIQDKPEKLAVEATPPPKAKRWWARFLPSGLFVS